MKLSRVLLVGLFMHFGLAQTATAALFNYAGPAASNVDTASVTNVTFNVADGSLISDLNVSVNVLGAYGTTGFPGNNNIWLSHGGVTVSLFNSTGMYAGAAGGIMDIIFDDESAFATPTSPPFTGNSRPIGSLSDFDGLSLNGEWTLSFSDSTYFPNEGDDLLAWSISGETRAVPEPSSLALLGLGLAGLGFARRKKA